MGHTARRYRPDATLLETLGKPGGITRAELQRTAVSLALRSLYARYGYVQYRMSRFEEYELYVSNKDFLISSDVITFTDTNGRLMALKPDVTLSIVRASRFGPGQVQKVYYDENVYRISKSSRGFREIRQVGAGVPRRGGRLRHRRGAAAGGAEPASASLAESALCVSHLGLVGAMLDALGLPGRGARRALRCIGEKNLHELGPSAGKRRGRADAERLKALRLLCGAPEEVLPELERLGCERGAVEQLRRLTAMLRAGGVTDGLILDLSVLGDMRYYNGVAFRGFVRGVSASVLSGGQYDRLLGRMGKKGRAIGFACYLDQLERLDPGERRADVDTVLLYDEHDAPERVAAAVRSLVGEGLSVSAQKAVPEKGVYGRVVRLSESGVDAHA